jgi:electron transport complex protein RnfB
MLAERINQLLPQTQCTKCGFDGCAPYARAIAQQQAPINRCPPGGDAGIAALAELLNVPILPLDTTCGEHQPLKVAVIEEQYCIGCTLCIQACPVDAIIGASKLMHTVISEDCTGCDLCVAPCPVDCITMVEVSPPRDWTTADAHQARARYERRQHRLNQSPGSLRHDQPEPAGVTTSTQIDKQAAIHAALARARAKRQKTA